MEDNVHIRDVTYLREYLLKYIDKIKRCVTMPKEQICLLEVQNSSKTTDVPFSILNRDMVYFCAW